MSDLAEFVKRAIKYLLEGLVVAFVALLVPRKALQVEEIVVIAMTAAAGFSCKLEGTYFINYLL